MLQMCGKDTDFWSEAALLVSLQWRDFRRTGPYLGACLGNGPDHSRPGRIPFLCSRHYAFVGQWVLRESQLLNVLIRTAGFCNDVSVTEVFAVLLGRDVKPTRKTHPHMGRTVKSAFESHRLQRN